MDVECFIDRCFKGIFAEDLEETTVNNCVQVALQLAPLRVRHERQPTEPVTNLPSIEAEDPLLWWSDHARECLTFPGFYTGIYAYLQLVFPPRECSVPVGTF